MAKNYFTDYPERVDLLTKYSNLSELAIPLEKTFGEEGFYKSAEEAVETWKGVLEEIGRFTANEIRPTAEAIDRKGAKLVDGDVVLPEELESHLRRSAELGIYGLNVARKYGGLNIPRAVLMQALEMYAQACPNTALNISCFCMADWIQLVASEDQKEWLLPKLISHEWRTSMALTEPNAGSDLGKLRTSAVKKGDHWIINGTKQFITNGQGDVAFALVRTDPSSQGLRGLSVMIVPKVHEGKRNFVVPKIEDKVCLHASPTCEMVFENSVGFLMGGEGDGFRVMAELMNGARLTMGALCVGIITGALEEAKAYASTRVTMGKPIIQHPMIADMIYEMEVESRALRTLVMEAARAADWMVTYKAQGDEKNYKRWKLRYRRLTPLVKYWGSERAIVHARNALQIFGGYGVCREYPVERLLRETLIYPIYEGTSQIQSLMVLKDTLKDVPKNAGGFLGSLAGAWAQSKVTTDPLKGLLLQARHELNQGIRHILMSILKDKFKSDIESLKENRIKDWLTGFSANLLTEKTDLTVPFLCAEKFTKITSDYYTLKCLVDNHVAGDEENALWIKRFAEIALPRMRYENTIMTERLPATIEYMRRQSR